LKHEPYPRPRRASVASLDLGRDDRAGSAGRQTVTAARLASVDMTREILDTSGVRHQRHALEPQ